MTPRVQHGEASGYESESRTHYVSGQNRNDEYSLIVCLPRWPCLGCVHPIDRLFPVSDGKQPIEDQRQHGPQGNARDVHPRDRQTLHT